jgi:hypothetical protein
VEAPHIDNPDERFVIGLGVVIQGIAARIKSQKKGKAKPPK